MAPQTGEQAYDALSLKHRKVIDVLGSGTDIPGAYKEVYECSEKAADKGGTRLSKNVQFMSAVAWSRGRVTGMAVAKTDLTLELVLDRIAEMVSAESGAKLVIKKGRVVVIPPETLRKYLELGCKVFQVTGELRDQHQQDPSAGITRGRMLPESLTRADADAMLDKGRRLGTLPGLTPAKPVAVEDPEVVVLEKDEPKSEVYEHPEHPEHPAVTAALAASKRP